MLPNTFVLPVYLSRVKRCVGLVRTGRRRWAIALCAFLLVVIGPSKALAANTCGVDIGGWTLPTPTAYEPSVPILSPKQPGSRIYYISADHGSDQTGQIYFWNGSNIVDVKGSTIDSAGQLYGTDPFSPSPAVRPFRRWAYVGPRSSATSDVGSPGKDIWVGAAAPIVYFREGYPDWWLFARGETFDLSKDLLSFAQESDPSITSLQTSLAVPGGRSACEREVMGAYGDLCLPRPRFIHPQKVGFVDRLTRAGSMPLKHVAYLSLQFDNHDRLSENWTNGVTLLNQTSDSVDILFEDIWMDGGEINIGGQNSGQITFRRSLITDLFETNSSGKPGPSAIYYEGSRQGRLRIEESLLLRNGFMDGDPATMPWPPSGTQSWDIYTRNMYISGEINSMESGLFDSVSMMGASGDQFRPGMRLERNFFYQGYVSMGAHGGYPDSVGPTGTIIGNVLQRFTGTGTQDNRGQPGWGLVFGSGASGVTVTDNIVTGAQSPATSFAFELTAINQDDNVPFSYPARNNYIFRNVFDSGNAASAVLVVDGTTNPKYGWKYPGLLNNTFAENIVMNSRSQLSQYAPVGGAVGTSDNTRYDRNEVYTSRSAAASALGWTGADRTLKSYMIAQGVPVQSTDGFPEYFAKAIQQRRGQWHPEWTARSLVNYVRQGFALPALSSFP